MNKTMIVAVMTAMSFSAVAAEEKVISVDGKEIAYVGQAVKGADGVVKVDTRTVFIGEKIVKDEHDVCSKETYTLISMNKLDSLGLTVELPNVDYRRVQIVCPS